MVMNGVIGTTMNNRGYMIAISQIEQCEIFIIPISDLD